MGLEIVCKRTGRAFRKRFYIVTAASDGTISRFGMKSTTKADPIMYL